MIHDHSPHALPPSSEPPFSAPGFLTAADQREMRHQLRGITSVELRQIGGTRAIGHEVLKWLQAEGLEVQFRTLERMTPPPLRRIAFRFQGRQAILTLAPEIGI